MCVSMCACIQLLMQDLLPSLVSVPALKPLHPSGRSHPDSVNNADSKMLYWRLGSASEEMTHTGGEEGYPKTEEAEKNKLMQRFGKRINKIKLNDSV